MKLEDVRKSQGAMTFEMTHVKIKKPGSLRLNNVRFETIPNFVDYLKSGLELNMIAAIDFTGIFIMIIIRFEWHTYIILIFTLLKRQTHPVPASPAIDLGHNLKLRQR